MGSPADTDRFRSTGSTRGFVWGTDADVLAAALTRYFGGPLRSANQLTCHLSHVGLNLESTTAHRVWRALAMTACMESSRLVSDLQHSVGLACSLRPVSGSHELRLAIQHPSFTTQATYRLDARTAKRFGALDQQCLAAVRREWETAWRRLSVSEHQAPVDAAKSDPGEASAEPFYRSEMGFASAPIALQGLLFGSERLALFGKPQSFAASNCNEIPDAAVMPGAFDPLHDGHRQMAEVGAKRLGKPVLFELSARNVDKPTLDYLELSHRQSQFDGHELCVTRAATFAEKAVLFPRATFLVGMDTILRIAAPRYYASPDIRLAAFDQLRRQGCRFLVFGRELDGKFQSLVGAKLPSALRSLCSLVSEDDFRHDLSSSELRRRQALG